MDKREEGLEEIKNRVKLARESLGVATFKRLPDKPVTDYGFPAIFMDEGVDEIINPSSREPTGYPARREMEVILEMVADRSYNIKQLYRNVRSVIFADGVVVADKTIIREIRTEGPAGYGLPDVVGMRLILALQYTDDGN